MTLSFSLFLVLSCSPSLSFYSLTSVCVALVSDVVSSLARACFCVCSCSSGLLCLSISRVNRTSHVTISVPCLCELGSMDDVAVVWPGLGLCNTLSTMMIPESHIQNLTPSHVQGCRGDSGQISWSLFRECPV